MEHVHCNDCFHVRKCKYKDCEIIFCKNGCQSSYHMCKQLEHEILCANALMTCINQCNGCEITFPRYQLARHLQLCPASVVVCSYTWSRWSTETKLMHSLKPVPRDININHAKHLDIALTIRDQKVLVKDLNGLNTTYSIDPYKLSIFSTTSSSRKTAAFRVTSIWCNKQFRRDEFPTHYKNIHYDVAELLPRLEQRCPLFNAGCMFTQTSVSPSKPGWKITVAKEFGAICTLPMLDAIHQIPSTNGITLGDLPQEVLEHIFGFLDTLSLLHLLKVNRRINEIVWSRVKHRGVVEPVWKNWVKFDGHTRKSSWKITHMKWSFTTAMGAVTKWVDKETECHVSDHLKVCPYFQRANHKVPYFAFWPNHPEVKENALVLAKLEENVSKDSSLGPSKVKNPLATSD